MFVRKDIPFPYQFQEKSRLILLPFFPGGEEGPELFGGTWRKVEKMDTRRDGFVKEVRVHLSNLFVKGPDGSGHLHNGKGLSQFNLDSVQLEGAV